MPGSVSPSSAARPGQLRPRHRQHVAGRDPHRASGQRVGCGRIQQHAVCAERGSVAEQHAEVLGVVDGLDDQESTTPPPERTGVVRSSALGHGHDAAVQVEPDDLRDHGRRRDEGREVARFTTIVGVQQVVEPFESRVGDEHGTQRLPRRQCRSSASHPSITKVPVPNDVGASILRR